ncbi:hypothetical protein NDU88_004224 [Pleurodeles waltl]|uniref:Uncharacterized protein n=1 Tax=Pleurodeles waltl TaxID=8319 RepID=A0AAV7QBZ4_PLEWA|nr:hypothetical protein NDU88_004224 [Pleurodeles waltl]
MRIGPRPLLRPDLTALPGHAHNISMMSFLHALNLVSGQRYPRGDRHRGSLMRRGRKRKRACLSGDARGTRHRPEP